METLEEIAMEGKETFLHAGGTHYEYIPALNDHESLINALTELSLSNFQGWLKAPPSEAELQAQVQRAKALGAKD